MSSWKLSLVLILLVGILIMLRMLIHRKRGHLSRGAKCRIELVSSFYLEPRKSIRVVRIAGQLFVLGVSRDSMNLITELNEEPETEAAPEKQGQAPSFSGILNSERSRPVFDLSGSTGSLVSTVRAKIQSRIKELKPL